MTGEQQASDALRALTREPVQLSDEGLRVVLAALPSTTQRRAWVRLLPDRRLQSMFSATKFVVAGVIVALFGGFLLAGVLPLKPSDDPQPAAVASAPASASPQASPTVTPSMEPTTAPEAVVRTDLVPDVALTVEEVASGVYRILDDGAGHDLATPMSAVLPIDDTGGLWIVSDPRRSMIRLGESGSASWERPWSAMSASIKVAADGTVWALRDSERVGRTALYRLDGTTWIEQPLPHQNDSDGVPGEARESAFESRPTDGCGWH
jgi:hypothetical protein